MVRPSSGDDLCILGGLLVFRLGMELNSIQRALIKVPVHGEPLRLAKATFLGRPRNQRLLRTNPSPDKKESTVAQKGIQSNHPMNLRAFSVGERSLPDKQFLTEFSVPAQE